MAIRYYDEALAAKIQSWVKDPNLKVLKPDQTKRLFEMKADINQDKPLSLPIIALSRDTSVQVDCTVKRSFTFNGYPINQTEKQTLHLDAIPITVNYQIDIFTQKYEEGDEYLRNFIFQIINNPSFKVSIPYNNANLEHIANIGLMSTVTDNSDIPEKLFADQFTRWTIELELRDGYLFSVPANANWVVDNASLDVQEDASKPGVFTEEQVDIKQ
jgi:hypothetical protein